MKQIAILGGTFDPIHIGHLIAGQYVYDTGLFNEICIMPSGNPPHKISTEAYNKHRLAMCQLAADSLEGFTVSDIEQTREGKIYTVDTFSYLKENNPGTKFWLIIGTDSLMNLKSWYKPEQLLATVNFVVVDRGGYDLAEIKAMIKSLDEGYKCDLLYVKMPLIELSSTTLRERMKKGLSIENMVPHSVHQYMMTHELYRS